MQVASPPEAVESLVFTRADVAHVAKISERQVKRLTTAGAIWGVMRLGRRCVRYNRALVLAWIERGCPATTGPDQKRKPA